MLKKQKILCIFLYFFLNSIIILCIPIITEYSSSKFHYNSKGRKDSEYILYRMHMLAAGLNNKRRKDLNWNKNIRTEVAKEGDAITELGEGF